VITNVGRQYRLEESSVKAIAQALTESAPKVESFSESAAHAGFAGFAESDKRAFCTRRRRRFSTGRPGLTPTSPCEV
jgi:hypothetical protein